MLFGKYINKYYKRYWYFFLMLMACDIFVDIIQLFIPKITGGIISILNSPDAKEAFMTSGVRSYITTNGQTVEVPFYFQSFTWALCTLAVLTVLIVLSRMGWRIASARIGAKIERDMRREMYAHIQTLSLTYYSSKKVGGLLSFFTSDLQSIKQLFSEGMIFLIDLTVLGSLSFIYMMTMSWTLGLICTIPLVLFIVLGGVVGKGETKRSKAAGDAFEDLSDYTEENLQGFAVIKAFRKEDQKNDGFDHYASVAKEKNIRFAHYSSLLDGGINFIITVMFALLLGFGAYSLIQINPVFLGNIKDSGDFIRFSGYCDSLIWPMIAGGILINDVSNARAAYIRISGILDAKEDMPDSPDSIHHDHIKGDIVMNHLTFRYPDSENGMKALEDISFTVKPGMMVGILGRTGSGKSTLISLLPKLYPVDRGMLVIDGSDINDWKKGDLREHIGLVSQSSYLFSGTVRESIAFSEPGLGNIDDAKVREAARFASIEKDILDMEKGYDTLVGEKGSSVSGGQRQRISIARAIYKNPDVLILDDSLSAVDADTEKTILANIREKRHGLTTFVIAHRISALENCDIILVLDQGRLVGLGRHDELVDSCKLYHDIVMMQKLEKEVA